MGFKIESVLKGGIELIVVLRKAKLLVCGSKEAVSKVTTEQF